MRCYYCNRPSATPVCKPCLDEQAELARSGSVWNRHAESPKPASLDATSRRLNDYAAKSNAKADALIVAMAMMR